MKRLFKKIIIGAGYLVIIFGIVYLVFNSIYQPTCFDGFKNQNEEGVDCGGVCAPCELQTLLYPVTLNKVYFVNKEGNNIDVAIEIKNPNANWGIRSFDYQIDFLDENGSVIPGSLYGKSYILPNETKWIMELAKFTPSNISTIDFKINTSTIVWNKLRPYIKEEEFFIQNANFRKLSPPQLGSAEITGIVYNNSNFDVQNVEVQAVLYDAQNRIVAIGLTNLYSLPSKRSSEFRIFWLKPLPDDTENFELFLNTNLLSDVNFIREYGL
mgnify:FL=1|jgi:hypothetical protein